MRQLVGLLCAAAVLAQRPSGSASQEPILLRSSTKLVQVNVVALDRKGEPVQDLKAADFELSDNGKPQQISFFILQRGGDLVEPPAKLQPNVFSNPVSSAGVPNSVIVILLDGLNTDWGDGARVRQQVLEFLSTVRAEDRIALYSLGRSLRVLYDFTSDTAELMRKLQKYRGEMLTDLANSKAPQAAPDGVDQRDPVAMLNELGAPTQREAEYFTQSRVTNTVRSLEAIAAHLAGLPGRKSVIWVSGGFPMSMGMDPESMSRRFDQSQPNRQSSYEDVTRAVRQLNHAGVALYPADARGLVNDQVVPASSSMTGSAAMIPRPTFTTPNSDTMIDLANRTGGRAFLNRNDIARAVRIAAEDGRITYTLGYYPTSDADGKYHNLKLKVSRPGVTLRFRQGYFSTKEAQTDQQVVKSEIAQAVWSPLDATAVSVNARVDHNLATNQLEVIVQVDDHTITLDQRNGRWTGHLDIGFAQKDEEGQLYATRDDTLTLNLTKDNYDKLRNGGILYRLRLPLSDKAKVLRIVVRDGPSGLTGTLTVPLKQVKSYQSK